MGSEGSFEDWQKRTARFVHGISHHEDDVCRFSASKPALTMFAGQIGAPRVLMSGDRGWGAPLPPVRIYIGASSPVIQARQSVLVVKKIFFT